MDINSGCCNEKLQHKIQFVFWWAVLLHFSDVEATFCYIMFWSSFELTAPQLLRVTPFGLWARWEMKCVTLWLMSAVMMSCLHFRLHGLLDASPAKVWWKRIVVFVQNSDGQGRARRVKFNKQLLNSCGGTFLSVIDGCTLRADYGH